MVLITPLLRSDRIIFQGEIVLHLANLILWISSTFSYKLFSSETSLVLVNNRPRICRAVCFETFLCATSRQRNDYASVDSSSEYSTVVLIAPGEDASLISESTSTPPIVSARRDQHRNISIIRLKIHQVWMVLERTPEVAPVNKHKLSRIVEFLLHEKSEALLTSV